MVGRPQGNHPTPSTKDTSVTEQHQAGPANAVAVAYVHQDEVLYSWHHSMTQLLDWDLAHDVRIWSGGFVAIRCGTDGLAQARNTAVRDFLRDSTADWLWWVDTDMGFMPDTVDRLFEAADPTDRPVMGALCFANREVDNDGMGGRRALAAPLILHWTHEFVGGEAGFETRWDYPRNTVVRCDGIGSACVLIHRSVFEKVREQYGEHWYSRAPNPSTGELISEDLSFCARMMALDIPVHVHTGVPTTHAKRFWLAEEDYWRQRALNPPPVTAEQRAAGHAKRDWTIPRYAIIPTHNRPARLLALVASLGTQCDHIVVLDNASEPPVDVEKLERAAGDALVQVFRDEEQPPNLARFWNTMFDACAHAAKERDEDVYDVAVLNDDSVVPAGWYDACSTGLRGHDTAVISHTTPTTPALLTELHNDPYNRMTPHAFVIRGEADMRADEAMLWWYFDSDLDQRARLAGGVLSVNGPRVANALANTTTRGVLAEQAEKDRATFEAKWSQ
jgi:GT2 family glycosyltransferase